MINTFRKWLHQKTAPAGEESTLRRWEAARTNRLNQAHWSQARGHTINSDLIAGLDILRTRATYEAANNPLVEGMINTHITDLIGSDGPILQVSGNDEQYKADLEGIWKAWWASPDINGQLAGPEILRQWVKMWWICGEFLTQIVNDPSAESKIKMRLLSIHPRRLGTPADRGSDGQVTLGIRRTRTGKPISYFIGDAPENEYPTNASIRFVEIPAKDIIHGYRIDEPGQARGVPWLACVLDVIADLRDYDAQVLDICKSVADYGLYLYTESPDAKFFLVNEEAPIHRRTISTLPPHYKLGQPTQQQPAAVYTDYRKERMLDLGRPVNMPLMMVRLDSTDHSYSSARFDSQLYNRSNRANQGWLERHAMNLLVDAVRREAEIAKMIKARPADAAYDWTWPVPPRVDEQKEAAAQQLRLQMGLSTLSEECAAIGKDWEDVLKQQQKEQEALIAAGLPTGFGATNSTPATPTAADPNADDNWVDPKKKNNTVAGKAGANA